MKKKKQRSAPNNRPIDLEKPLLDKQPSLLSDHWRNFVTIAYVFQIALLLYFVIVSLTTSTQEKSLSPVLCTFIGISVCMICYAAFQLYTSKNTSPFTRSAKRPIGTKFDHFLDQFAQYTAYLSYAIAAWATFYPEPYAWATYIAMIYPVLLIGIIKYSGNRFTLNQKDNGDRDFSYPMMASLIPSFARGIMDFSLDHYAQTWYLAVGVSLCMVLLFIKNIQTGDILWDDTDRYISFVSIWIVFLLYAIGLVRVTNCYFDTPIQEHNGYVVSKSTSQSKKNRSYWVKISPTGKDHDAETKSVDIDTYNKALQGNTVKIYEYKGTLNAKWHEVYF